MAEGGAIGIPMAQAVQMGESDAGMRGGGGGGGGAGMAMGGGVEGRFPPQRIDDLALPEVSKEVGRSTATVVRVLVVGLGLRARASVSWCAGWERLRTTARCLCGEGAYNSTPGLQVAVRGGVDGGEGR